MRRRHPLEPVRELLTRKKDVRARELGDRIRTTESLAARAGEATARRVEAERGLGVALEEESGRLSAGAQTALDLARGEAFQVAAAARIDERRKSEERALEALRAAENAEERSRREVVSARAEEQVVVRHRARLERSERRKAEERSDGEAEETAAARRPPRGTP